MDLVDEQVLKHEVEIVWDLSTEEIDYVRATIAYAGTRQRSVPLPVAGMRVGYAVLSEDAPNNGNPGTFVRRVFFLKRKQGRAGGDRCFDPGGNYSFGAPMEAVDPRTVAPGERGKMTPRARGAE